MTSSFTHNGTRVTVVQERRNRQTGTTIEVIDNRGGQFDAGDENGWITLCADHGNYASHPTRKHAIWHAPDPAGWCPHCQALLP